MNIRRSLGEGGQAKTNKHAPGLVHTSRDEAVHAALEASYVIHLLLSGRAFLVDVADVYLEAVQPNGILFKRASHGRADDVDDAGLRNDVVVHVEGVERTSIREQRVLGMMIRLEQEIPVHGAHG
jgi:hypothetical protein